MKGVTFRAELRNRMTAKGNEIFPAFVFLCFRYEKNTCVTSCLKSVVITFHIGC